MSLTGALTFLDIFYFHYIYPVNLKKNSEVKLVQVSHNHSNPRDKTMSKPQIQKNTTSYYQTLYSYLIKESQNSQTGHGHSDIYSKDKSKLKVSILNFKNEIILQNISKG